jgi:Dolichyl-phosphate-mannose-protein mannosyltransferase
MFWVAILSVVAGVILRAVAARDDLWFDEIWTLDLLGQHVHSFGDVFTNFKHSNNHHLTSLWMWLVGQEASGWIYRLPSVLASIGTIALAGLIAGRRSRLHAYVAVTLTSWSYLLIHFGTEARGYSAVVFFALLAWYALLRFQDRRSWLWRVLFWVAIVFGFLAHLEFAVCAIGLGAFSLRRLVCDREKWRRNLGDLLRLFAVPATLSLLFYLVAIRGMELGGGEPYVLAPLLAKTASYMVGGAGEGAVAWIVAILAGAAIVACLLALVRRRDEHWFFYAVVIAAPLLLIAITRPDQVYVRYFMVSVALVFALVASALADLLRRRSTGLAIGITLLALFVIGNAINTGNLLRFGRGQYRAALRFMENQSRDHDLFVTSDHDFRNAMLVNYYKRYLDRPGRAYYLDGAALEEKYAATNGESRGPEWLIVHRFDLTQKPDRLEDIYGNLFEIICIYRYSDLSGWNWLIYHNLNRPRVQPTEPLLR